MLRTRRIPENVLQGKRLFGFRKRNLAEGAVWAFIVYLIISSIPFVPKVRWILTICIGGFLILVNGIGIKGLPYSKVLLNMWKYRKCLKNYTYRRLNYADPEPIQLFENVNGRQKVRTIKENSKLARAKRLFRM